MFSGIIEQLGMLSDKKTERGNLHLFIKSSFTTELKIDQSVAHNGVCLTVVDIRDEAYKVTAIKETLDKTNISNIKIGDAINLERCLKVGDRLDGHIVQGHVDQTAICKSIENLNGSWIFSFEYDNAQENFVVKKGSICINGVSLTVVDCYDSIAHSSFSVAVIPYTFTHTNFQYLKPGHEVNLEFDIVGKYILAYEKRKYK
jgi:riboflavin synthase